MPTPHAHITQTIEGRRRYAVRQGDCLDLMRPLPDGCADLVNCDPPYGMKWCGKDNKQKAIANDNHPFIWWLYDARRILKPGGRLISFCNWKTVEQWRFAIEIAGFTIRSKIIWNKNRPGMGDTTAQFAPAYEVAWFATNGRFRFPGGRPMDVITEPIIPPSRRQHTTEKPQGVLRYLIGHLTEPDNLVVDPTCGSGSCGEAALNLGRRFIGFELDQDNAKIAAARLRLIDRQRPSGGRGVKAKFARPVHGKLAPQIHGIPVRRAVA